VTAAPPARDLDLALARVHLRTGSLGLARAELEALAGAGRLDERAVVDLAEARWRTGDLAGAGEAARAHLDAGGSAPVALVIAAEAVSALGRPTEARSLADRAMERLDRSLDSIFAGMPRSPIWPSEANLAAAETEAEDEARQEAAEAFLPSDATLAASPSDAAAALEAGRAALADGDTATAAIQLGVALRLSPLLAPAVLDLAAAERTPAMDLVRGDALNALGHESEAHRAWSEAAAGVRD
jgi:hypothetical protein